MSESKDKWVILHVRHNTFFRMRYGRPWTMFAEKSRTFPSRSAALAVMHEWGLEDIAEVCVICPAEG